MNVSVPTGIEPLRYEDRHLISDFYIPLIPEGEGGYEMTEADFANAYAYIGSPEARRLFDGSDSKLVKWLLDIYVKSDKQLRKSTNFRLEHEGTRFRAHRAQTTEGYELALRAIPEKVPHLDDLALDQRVRAMLMGNQLLYGGLIIVAAANGQGKTTTISATVRSRLERFAGHCNAVEDPPELPLHGWHGRGRCVQLPVATPQDAQAGTGYAQALVDVRRFFPAMAGGGTILMIGEVRNAETAAETLLAAFEGHLVLTTFHGSSVPHALMRYVALAGEKLGANNARDLMAATLRLCIHQKLKLHEGRQGWERGEVTADTLVVSGHGSRASQVLRDGDIGKVQAVLDEQRLALQKLPARDEQWMRTNANQIMALVDRHDGAR